MIVDDKYVLEVERQRAKLVDNLRHQGVWVEDDTPMDVCIEKMKEIYSVVDLFNKKQSSLSSEEIISIPPYAFYKNTGIIEVNLPYATKIDFNAFDGATGLKEINAPEVTNLGGGCFSNCSGLKIINFPKATTSMNTNEYIYCNSLKICNRASLPSISGNGFYGITDSLIICDLGMIKTLLNPFSPGVKNNLRHLIFRSDDIVTLPSLGYISNFLPIFKAESTKKGIIFTNCIIDFSTETNWSALNFVQKKIIGSRYEDIMWSTNRNFVSISVDNKILECIPDDEIVSVFKYTEDFNHLYDENGTEIPDDAIIGNYVGKLLTSEVA